MCSCKKNIRKIKFYGATETIIYQNDKNISDNYIIYFDFYYYLQIQFNYLKESDIESLLIFVSRFFMNAITYYSKIRKMFFLRERLCAGQHS